MTITQLTKLLEALSHERRVSILLLLLESKDSLHSAAISHLLGLPVTNTSFHLGKLAAVDLVLQAREGKYTLYTANKRTLYALVNDLTTFASGVATDEIIGTSNQTTAPAPEDSNVRLGGDTEDHLRRELGQPDGAA
jgi:ArsR family transcriptional regulator, arsenate/arsenite/antimonite-responsive transcriptional repressor